MTRITKYFGPPGTGKTTTLMNIVEEYLDKGTPPEKIAFISFSVASLSLLTVGLNLNFTSPQDVL